MLLVVPQSLSESTSPTLIGRVQQRDESAWNELAEVYGPLIYGWARRAGLQDSDAADVTQNVFQSVARAVGDFNHEQPGATFRGWLWTVAKNEVAAHFRRLKNRPQPSGGSDAQHRWREHPEFLEGDGESVSPASEAALLHRALGILQNEFEPGTWTAFRRMAVEDHPAADIARDLGMTSKAVRQAKYRVLCRLREFLRET